MYVADENMVFSEYFGRWLDACVKDPVLLRASTGLVAILRVQTSSENWDIQISDGIWSRIHRASHVDMPDVIMSAKDEDWLTLLETEHVKPGWQSFGAILRQNPRFTVTGEPLGIAQLLAGLERLIELAHLGKQRVTGPEPRRDITIIQGRYTGLGLPYSTASPIYWEESGSGWPLVMLHTAGADSRQYRHQISDIEVAQSWKMYAFDMPGHGRSGMPDRWQAGENYKLTQREYLSTCVAFLEQVVKRPAVIMGCSMGAAMSLVIAARRPDLVAGVIALEAPWRAPGRRSPLLADARVNASLHNPSYVRALLGPHSPQEYREDACWIYSQAGFGIYAGDLGFYSDEFDGDAIGMELAGADVPIYLLTGSYDYSASPENTRKLAQLIPHAEFQEMENLGHFPMIENPDYFRPYWVRTLDKLRGRLPASGCDVDSALHPDADRLSPGG